MAIQSYPGQPLRLSTMPVSPGGAKTENDRDVAQTAAEGRRRRGPFGESAIRNRKASPRTECSGPARVKSSKGNQQIALSLLRLKQLFSLFLRLWLQKTGVAS